MPKDARLTTAADRVANIQRSAVLVEALACAWLKKAEGETEVHADREQLGEAAMWHISDIFNEAYWLSIAAGLASIPVPDDDELAAAERAGGTAGGRDLPPTAILERVTGKLQRLDPERLQLVERVIDAIVRGGV